LPGLREHLKQGAYAAVYDERAEAVALMTMHAAKGLEFPLVFLAGLEEEILPCSIANLKSDEEEERRLFYVAMTRARERLILSNSTNRTIFHRTAAHRESRFIREIPDNFIDKTAPAPARKRKTPGAGQLTLF